MIRVRRLFTSISTRAMSITLQNRRQCLLTR